VIRKGRIAAQKIMEVRRFDGIEGGLRFERAVEIGGKVRGFCSRDWQVKGLYANGFSFFVVQNCEEGKNPERMKSSMNKVVLGLLLGALLGALDGTTAWFTPEARTQLAGIIIGSTIKGIIAGVAIGFFARKVNSLPLGILFGLAVGFVLAFIVARFMEHGHYFEIILPGSIVGLIVGYATQRFGAMSATASTR
jgi:hypothetical protein